MFYSKEIFSFKDIIWGHWNRIMLKISTWKNCTKDQSYSSGGSPWFYHWFTFYLLCWPQPVFTCYQSGSLRVLECFLFFFPLLFITEWEETLNKTKSIHSMMITTPKKERLKSSKLVIGHSCEEMQIIYLPGKIKLKSSSQSKIQK